MFLTELLDNLQIRIANLGLDTSGTEWEHKGVISPYSRMFFILDGAIILRHNNTSHFLSKGMMHIVPCFNLSDYECPEHVRFYYIHFTSRLKSGYDLFNIIHNSLTQQADPIHYSLFERLHALLPDIPVKVCRPHSPDDKKTFLKQVNQVGSTLDPSRYLEVYGIFRQILAAFLRNADEITNLPQQHFARILEHIEENLDKPLSLDELAELANLHPNYFSEQFVKVFGMRPIEYIIRQRIERSQNLLFGKNHTVKEIAAETGFFDVAHFSRTFKKYTGVAPSKFVDQFS